MFNKMNARIVKRAIIILLFLTCSMFAQNVYELTPGTTGNEITITLANISSANDADNIAVRLAKESVSLKFKTSEQQINKLTAQKETDVSFTFDVERSAPVNVQDTVEFFISDNAGIFISRKFIFSYVAPKEYKLEQNFPNPFNPTTTIQYQLPFESRVNLKVYNILGKEVAVLVDEIQSAGFKEIKFGRNDLASGVYVYRLSASGGSGNFSSIKKMLMVK
ncbi:MAG: T9SS type A sorting domain-containing protein [Ignavibacteriaceae bacterium]